MEKIIIQANPDNDLKFRQDLMDEEEKKKKKPVTNGELTENTTSESTLQYFTE